MGPLGVVVLGEASSWPGAALVVALLFAMNFLSDWWKRSILPQSGVIGESAGRDAQGEELLGCDGATST